MILELFEELHAAATSDLKPFGILRAVAVTDLEPFYGFKGASLVDLVGKHEETPRKNES